jgi:hypothetical protein
MRQHLVSKQCLNYCISFYYLDLGFFDYRSIQQQFFEARDRIVDASSLLYLFLYTDIS